MSMGIREQRDLPPGNVNGKKNDGSVRAPTENEPTFSNPKNLSTEEIAYKTKVTNWLGDFLKNTELFDKTDWPPKEILRNKKLKAELVNKLPKNFPFLHLDEALESLARLRVKI